MEGTSGVRRNRAYMEQIKAQVTQPDDGWVWGNHRGGGGAPVRDNDGNNVSNLKGIIPNHDQRNSGKKGRRDWSPELQEIKPKPKGGRRFREEVQDDQEEDTFEDIALPPRRGRQQPPVLQPRVMPKLGNHGGYQNDEEELFIPGLSNRTNTSASNNHNISPGNSPKKFMGAIQEMNSSLTNHEKQAKNKRELEYQAALRKQIEEKQRQKEEEKRKDDEIKRREYEEFMRHAQPGFIMPPCMPPSGVAGKQPPLFKESRQGQTKTANKYNNSNNSGKSNKLVPGLDFEVEDDEEEQQYDNRRGNGNGRKAAAPPAAANNNSRQQPSRSVYNRDDEDEGTYTPPRRQRRQQQQQYEESVPAEKYDELTALCEKLMRQQEELQAEIHQQASVIKELQKAKGAAPTIRSKSVQQPRPAPASEGRSSSVERRRIGAANDNNSNKQRPSSMHAAPLSRIPNELPFKKHNNSAAEQKKQLKVAFGGSVIKDDKKLSAPPSTAASNATNKQQQQGPKANKSTGDLLAHKRSSPVNGSAPSNGFAKLQMKTTGGPRVVTYEDDEADYLPASRRNNSNHGNGMQGSMNLELRGQSKYISVAGSEDEVSGDQLDRLLAGSRRAHGGY